MKTEAHIVNRVEEIIKSNGADIFGLQEDIQNLSITYGRTSVTNALCQCVSIAYLRLQHGSGKHV